MPLKVVNRAFISRSISVLLFFYLLSFRMHLNIIMKRPIFAVLHIMFLTGIKNNYHFSYSPSDNFFFYLYSSSSWFCRFSRVLEKMQYEQTNEKVTMIDGLPVVITRPLSATEDPQIQRIRKYLLIIVGVFLVSFSCYFNHYWIRKSKESSSYIAIFFNFS
jgi:hypothetical protein